MGTDMTIDHSPNGTKYFTPWRQGRRGVGTEVRRIISITRQVATWAVIAVEHYRGGETADVLHDEDYDNYQDALEALGALMADAHTAGFITRTDLERVPQAVR